MASSTEALLRPSPLPTRGEGLSPGYTSVEQKMIDDLTQRESKVDMAWVVFGLGAAFLLYVKVFRRWIREAMAGPEAPTRSRLIDLNRRLFSNYALTMTATIVPSLIAGYRTGMKEAKYGQLDDAWMQAMASEYALRLGEKIHQTSSEALIDGFTAQINRKVPARVAIDRAIDAFGVAPKTMKSLVSIWLSPPVQPSMTALPLRNRVAERADKMIARSINDRTRQFSQAEAYSAKNQAKAIVWMHKKDRIPAGTKVMWYTAADERVCSVCGPMHGKRREVDDQFSVRNHGTVWAPPLHPSCRCNILLTEPGRSSPGRSSPGRSSPGRPSKRRRAKLVPAEVAKADWEEIDHPRGGSGRFVRKPTAVAERESLTAEQMVGKPAATMAIPGADQGFAVPGAARGFAVPGAVSSTGLAIPQTDMSVPQASINMPTAALKVPTPQIKMPTPRMEIPGAKLDVPLDEPEVQLAEPVTQTQAGATHKQKWRKTTKQDQLYAIIPPTAAAQGNHILDSRMQFYTASTSGGAHPVDVGLEKYWDATIFHQANSLMKSEDGVVEHGKDWVKIEYLSLEDQKAMENGDAEMEAGIHEVVLTEKNYRDLWKATLSSDTSDPYMNVMVDGERASMLKTELMQWFDMPARAQMLMPMIGISNHTTEDPPALDSETNEVLFGQPSHWSVSGSSLGGVEDIQVYGIHHDKDAYGRAYGGVYWINPDDLQE